MMVRTRLYSSLRNGLIIGLPVNQGLNTKCSGVFCGEADPPVPPEGAPVNSELPGIVAQAQYCVGGDPLVATDGTWTSDTPVTYDYQWQVDAAGTWQDVEEATLASFEPSEAGTYRVCVTATNAVAGTTACSTTTAAVGVEPSNIGTPVITPSSSAPGEVLTAGEGTWSGTLPITYTYQWQEDIAGTWTDIVGETDSTYTPVDAGSYRVIVTADNDCGLGTQATSPAVTVEAPEVLAVVQSDTAAHAGSSATTPLTATLNGVAQGSSLLLVVAGDDEAADIAPSSLSEPAGATWSKIGDHQVPAWVSADSCGCVVYRADDVDAGTQAVTASGWAGFTGSITLIEATGVGALGITGTAGQPNYRVRPVDMGVTSPVNPDAAEVLVLTANAVTCNTGASGDTQADATYVNQGGVDGTVTDTVVQSSIQTFDGSTPAVWDCDATTGNRNINGWASLMLVFGTGSGPTPPGDELTPLSATPIEAMSAPAVGVWSDDTTFGLPVMRLSTPSDSPPSTRNRHDYSRRDVFNADKTRYIMVASDGYWLLYDGTTHTFIRRMSGMGGDAEGLWHPTDPDVLYYRAGTAWYSKNVLTDANTLLHDFEDEYPTATHAWTKAEGCMSADGQMLGLLISRYDAGTQNNIPLALLAWNPVTDTIVGQLAAASFGNSMPDHVSTSPSGTYIVPSWTNTSLGTRAYTTDFSTFTQLLNRSEHSDLAFGPAGEDYYVAADYGTGQIICVDMATGSRFNLLSLYPRAGSGYACHISGKAFDQQGWVLVSAYADKANYGSTVPDPILEPPYRKLFLMELVPGGRKLNVVPTHQNGTGYYDEPQASWTRDGTLAVFASRYGSEAVSSSYAVEIPTTEL